MAKYHITAEKLREKYDLDKIVLNSGHWDNLSTINLELILDLMRSCSQLRQSKVIESFFKECFKNVETEYIKIDGKYGKFQKLRVIV